MSHLLAAVMNTVFALGAIPLIWTIERFGRRGILLWSAVALTACLVVFVTMVGLPNPTLTTQWVAVAAIVIYNGVFGYGWIGVCWLYGPEVGVADHIAILKRLTAEIDRPSQASPCRRRSWSLRRVAVFFHHSLWWRDSA